MSDAEKKVETPKEFEPIVKELDKLSALEILFPVFFDTIEMS